MEAAGNIYSIIIEIGNDLQKEYKAKVTRCDCAVMVCVFSSPMSEHIRALCIIHGSSALARVPLNLPLCSR